MSLRDLPELYKLRLPTALQFYRPVIKEQNPGGEHGVSISSRLELIAQRKECALEDVKTENTVRNKNNVLTSQSTLKSKTAAKIRIRVKL